MTLTLLVTTLGAALAADTRSGSSGTLTSGGGGTRQQCLAPGDDTPIPDITIPTGDSQYDLYARTVDSLTALLTPPRTVPQIGEGMATLLDPDLSNPHGTIEVVKDVLDETHYTEHWFIDATPAAWDGEEAFALEMDADAELPPAWAGWQDKVYLYMDVKYYTTPQAAFFGGLTLPYAASPLLEGWAYDIVQDGEVVGHLLREEHANDNWVDYWLYGPDYDKPAADDEWVAIEPWPIQPVNATGFFNALPPLQANFTYFSKVTYKVRKGCAYYEFSR